MPKKTAPKKAPTLKEAAAMTKAAKAAFADFGIKTPATKANRDRLMAMLQAANDATKEARASAAANKAAKQPPGTVASGRIKLASDQGDIESLAIDAERDRMLVLTRSVRSLHYRFVVVTLSTRAAQTIIERDGATEPHGFQAQGLQVLPDGRFVTSVYEMNEKQEKGRVSPWIVDVDAATLTAPAKVAWRALENTSIISHGPVRLSADGTHATVDLDFVETTWSLGRSGFTLAPKAKPVSSDRFYTTSGNADDVTMTLGGRRVTRRFKRGLRILGASPAGVIALGGLEQPARVLDVRSGKLVFEKNLRMRSPVGAVDVAGKTAAFGYGTEVQLVVL